MEGGGWLLPPPPPSLPQTQTHRRHPRRSGRKHCGSSMPSAQSRRNLKVQNTSTMSSWWRTRGRSCACCALTGGGVTTRLERQSVTKTAATVTTTSSDALLLTTRVLRATRHSIVEQKLWTTSHAEQSGADKPIWFATSLGPQMKKRRSPTNATERTQRSWAVKGGQPRARSAEPGCFPQRWS